MQYADLAGSLSTPNDPLGSAEGLLQTHETSQSRTLLVRKLADLLVLSQGKISNNERDFIADILMHVLGQVSSEIVREVSTRLAAFTDVPVQIQRFLLSTDISIAAPLLDPKCPLSESLILEACAKGFVYREAITMRDDLSHVIVDHLISFGEEEIILMLLKRDDISIPASTMDILVQRSEADQMLTKFLLRRPELRLEHGFSMFWWLDTAKRKTILARFATDRTIIQDAMHELFVDVFTSDAPDPIVLKVLKLVDRRHRPRGRNGETVGMDMVKQTLKVARAQPTSDLIEAVALLAGVCDYTAERALKDYSGEAFAILCKSIGVSRSDFQELFFDDPRFPNAGPEYSGEKVDDLLGVFDSIARDFSRTILRYWDWRFEAHQSSSVPTPFSEGPTNTSTYFGAI